MYFHFIPAIVILPCFRRPLKPVIHSSPDRVVLVEGRRHSTLIASLLSGVNGSRRIYWALQWTSIPFREEATETGDKRRPDGPLGSYAAFTLPSGPARFILGTQIKGKNLFLYQLQCGSRPLLINSFNIREKITPYHTMTFHIPVGLYHWMSYKRFEIAKTSK